jgi:sensor c-di-GMP phosphodiesterase-like protein
MVEQHHRMNRITDRMLDILVNDARESLARHAGQRYVSINLSAQDLSDTAIVEKLRQTREESGLPRLIVEATEGGLLNVDRANSIIQRLGELDISVAIDDFGIGYSSLSYLGTLRAAYLKLDKSFVSAIGSDGVTRHVIDHIIAMAKDCGLTLIAEGLWPHADCRRCRERRAGDLLAGRWCPVCPGLAVWQTHDGQRTRCSWLARRAPGLGGIERTVAGGSNLKRTAHPAQDFH